MRSLMRCTLIALAAPLALAGCATSRPAAPTAAASQPASAASACLALKAYTPDQLRALAAAVRALPQDSPLRGMAVDYERLRDEARAACAAEAVS